MQETEKSERNMDLPSSFDNVQRRLAVVLESCLLSQFFEQLAMFSENLGTVDADRAHLYDELELKRRTRSLHCFSTRRKVLSLVSLYTNQGSRSDRPRYRAHTR